MVKGKISIAICDDEQPFLETISSIIKDYFKDKQTQVTVRCFHSGEELLAAMSTSGEIDLFFLDVNMNNVDGIDVAKEIRKHDTAAVIVFVTAFLSYSTEGYKVDAFRYIIKNDMSLKVSMIECLDAIKERFIDKASSQLFMFRKFEKEINIQDILYIESKLHLLHFYMADKGAEDYSMYETLDNIEERLSEYNFLRIHQSYLVNLKHIKKVSLYKIILSDDTELVVPKARYKAVREAIVTYKGRI